MKKLLTLLFLSFGLVTFGQVYQLMPQYGYQANRFRFDSTLQIPTVCGVPTLKSNVNKLGAIAFDSCNNRFYTYNPKTAVWSQVSGSGGPTDTSSLSARINLKIDSVKRRSDSVFAYRNGTEVFQFRDSIKYDTSTVVIMSVVNVTGTTLLKGEVVYLFGATGNTASVKRANNKSDSTSSKTIGIVRRDIAAGATGTVTTQGQVEKLNLGAYNEGDILWLDSIDGGLTKNKPQAPFHAVFVGVVERANQGNGTMYIKPANGVEISEIHDILIQTPLNKQILVYSDTLGVWKNRSVYSVIDTTALLSPYFKRSLSANDTIKTNGKALEINAKGPTKNTSIKLDTLQVVVNAEQTNGSASLLLNAGQTLLSQIDGSYTNQMSMNTDGINFLSTDGSSVRGLVVNSTLGTYWYSTSNDTTGIFPTTKGTTGKILKLQNDKQLIWANDSIGTTIDTSAFQRKQLAAYSFQANGTGVAANSVATYFKDTSGTYTGSAVWNGTSPSGATNHSYRWTRIGKMVTLNINLVYATNGATNSILTMDFPSDCPTPAEPAGLTGASQNMYPALIWTSSSTNVLLSAAQRGFLRNNAANNGYDLLFNFSSHAPNSAYITLTYWTN